MFVSAVLPFLGVTLLLCIACANVGSALVTSQRSIVAMTAGWCVFLLLCSVPWAAGLSAHAVRPLFWAFYAAGLVLAVRRRHWGELTAAVICSAAVTVMLGWPFLRTEGMLGYGAHGLDMWGYVITAEWLQHHSLRELPVIAVDPIRFNWTWHVLTIRDRPLIYESLACLGSSTGLTPTQAYLTYPVALMASLVMSLAREPGMFRLKYWALALLPCLALVFHPVLVLPWIAGFFGGTMTAFFAALAFATAATPAEGPQRAEAWAVAVLMFVGCAGLYTLKFLLIALAVGGAPLALALAVAALRRDFSPLRRIRPSRRLIALLVAIAALTTVVLIFGRDQPVDTGRVQAVDVAAKHVLGIFGGVTPYQWLDYERDVPFGRSLAHEKLGLVALVLFTALLILVVRARWQQQRDLSLPLLVGLCAGALMLSCNDELIMAKALPIFGFALLVILAVISGELRHRWLGVLAAILCALAGVRGTNEMQDVIRGPYITATRENVSIIYDGFDWRALAYLHFSEDTLGLDWTNYPRSYTSITQFLPAELQQRLAKKYHMEKK